MKRISEIIFIGESYEKNFDIFLSSGLFQMISSLKLRFNHVIHDRTGIKSLIHGSKIGASSDCPREKDIIK